MGRLGKSRAKPYKPFEPYGFSTGDPPHRNKCIGWQGDPYQTTDLYTGKHDMDTLTKRFGSWTGVQKQEIEPRVNVGNLMGERYRLGMGLGPESGQVTYPLTEHPGHICNYDLSEDGKCPFKISLGKLNLDWPTVSRPGSPWYCTQRLNPEHRLGPPKVLKAHMPPAGIPTTNDCALASQYHPAGLTNPQLKRVLLQKTLGQFTNPAFKPKPGDILILQRARKHSTRDAGFVQFYTAAHAHQKHLWNHGDLIVRLGKLVHRHWKMCKDFKMFKLIQKSTSCASVGRWMIIGLLQREPRKLVPLHERKSYVLQSIVPEFWPRRGDLLVRSDASGNRSQLDWAVVPVTGPSYRPGHGDVILRAYMQRPMAPLHGVMAGSIEMFLYDGKGSGWVFMGRDETVIDAKGQDVLELMCHGGSY